MRILVLGAGMMGYAAVFDLLKNKNIAEVIVGDKDIYKLERLEEVFDDARLKVVQTDVSNFYIALGLMNGVNTVVSAVNYEYNYRLAKAAIEAGANFCDLGGNHKVVREELTLDEKAKQKGVIVIPDCGLAPGSANILAADGMKKFDKPKSVRIRVGGLPLSPKPPLNYKVVFSPLGLINEYVEPAIAIKNGEIVTLPSMTEIEEVEFPKPFGKLEAFTTSGGVSTLPQTYEGVLEELDYKTIRYKGHCENFKKFIDLGLCSDKIYQFGNERIAAKKFFAKILSEELSDDAKDCVLLRIDITGEKDGKEKKLRYEIIDYPDEKNGMTAMMRNTGYPVSIIAQMMAEQVITEKGVIPQESSVPSDLFIKELGKRGINVSITEL